MDEKTFKKQLKSGIFYTALAKYSGIVISLGVTAVLSRLLTPEDFGVIAVATVIIVFFTVFSDMGIGSAIVQKRNLTESDYDSIFTFTVYSGLGLGAIFFGSSWIIARIYDDPQLVVLCQVLSAQIVFSTWNLVPNNLLLKDQQFKFLGVRTLIVQIFLAGISIGAAFLGFGVYTLLINPVGGTLGIFLLTYIKRPVKFHFRFTFEAVKKIAGYSAYNFGFGLINYFTRNLDKLMVGKVFGLSPLGYYEKSYRLMLLPVQNLTFVITPVLHPVFAELQDNLKEQTRKFLKLMTVMAMIGMPLSAYLYFAANDLVYIIFGSQWGPSIPVFQILSLTCGLQIVGSTTGSFFLATNHTKEMFYIGLFNSIINIGTLFIGIYAIGTIEGVAWMYLASSYFNLWNLFVLSAAMKEKPFEAFKPYLPSLLPTAICAVALWPVYQFTHLSLVVSLVVKTFIFIIVLLPSLQLSKTVDVIGIVKNYMNKIRSPKLA